MDRLSGGNVTTRERRMVFLFAVLSIALQPLAVDPVAAAATDARRLGSEAVHVRYVWIGGVEAKERVWIAQTISSHVNRLSREPEIVRPIEVAAGLLRVDLRDYQIDSNVWDTLHDPYFQVVVKTQGTASTLIVTESVATSGAGRVTLTTGRGTLAGSQPGTTWSVVEGKWPMTVDLDGESVRGELTLKAGVNYAVSVKRGTPGAGEQRAFAPWHTGVAAKELLEATQSPAAIVNGVWWFNQTAIQADRKPGYYDFLGVTNEKDFDKLVGFNADVLKTFPKESREAVSTSTVAHQPRRLDRAGTVGGGYWRTSDNRLATGDRNPIRVLGDGFKFDARESFGHLPNGLFAWFLGDSNGVRQDAAPDFIASDSTAPGTDKRVHINLSCIRCHTTGVQDIRGWARSVFQGQTALASTDANELRKLRRLYMTPLEPLINRDREIYADAVKAATGLTVEADSANHAKLWAMYEEARIDRAYMARDLGCTEEHLVAACKARLAATGQLDPVFANVLGPNLAIHAKQWEEVYAQAQALVRGLVPVGGK